MAAKVASHNPDISIGKNCLRLRLSSVRIVSSGYCQQWVLSARHFRVILVRQKIRQILFIVSEPNTEDINYNRVANAGGIVEEVNFNLRR